MTRLDWVAVEGACSECAFGWRSDGGRVRNVSEHRGGSSAAVHMLVPRVC